MRRHDAAVGREQEQRSKAACAASSLCFSLQQQQVDWARRITNSRRHSVSPFLFSILLSPYSFLFPFTLWIPLPFNRPMQSVATGLGPSSASYAHLPPSAAASLSVFLPLSRLPFSRHWISPFFSALCSLFLCCAWILQRPAVLRYPVECRLKGIYSR